MIISLVKTGIRGNILVMQYVRYNLFKDKRGSNQGLGLYSFNYTGSEERLVKNIVFNIVVKHPFKKDRITAALGCGLAQQGLPPRIPQGTRRRGRRGDGGSDSDLDKNG